LSLLAFIGVFRCLRSDGVFFSLLAFVVVSVAFSSVLFRVVFWGLFFLMAFSRLFSRLLAVGLGLFCQKRLLIAKRCYVPNSTPVKTPLSKIHRFLHEKEKKKERKRVESANRRD
jgi:hypothetical protein